MSDVMTLNGYSLLNSFVSGYENLVKHKKYLNDINVFPVPDGDTGNNMVTTFYSTIQAPSPSRSLSETLNGIADRALSGARGNSGIIVAQFLNGLASECADRETMTTNEFGSALRNAAALTYTAIENPKEGTLITIIRIWAEEMYRMGGEKQDFRDLFVHSIEAARIALEKTKDQLDVLKKANVVDAGASGFVSFLEGVARMIITGAQPRIKKSFSIASDDEEMEAHDTPNSPDTITFRYCTEALILRSPRLVDPSSEELREKLRGLGDSLIISHGREKTKLHIHTDDPSRVFFELRGMGRVIEQKVDDMRLQYNAIHGPVSKIAIITDSIADIPQAIIDRYQIHVIPLKILWGDDEYLDRVTLSDETFYPYLDSREDYPSSSTPDPRRVEQVFSWVASHYESIIAVSVAKVQSGTWQVMENCAKKMRETGYRVTVIDSKLNSAAEGLVVLSAAEDAASGMPYDEIVSRVVENSKRGIILVSLLTLKYMVRGGRISALKGLVAGITGLRPIVTLDVNGSGSAFGTSFTKGGNKKKIIGAITKKKDTIKRYAVVHAGVPDEAFAYAAELTRILGRDPEYVMAISPVVGLHAGIGAVAVAYT